MPIEECKHLHMINQLSKALDPCIKGIFSKSLKLHSDCHGQFGRRYTKNLYRDCMRILHLLEILKIGDLIFYAMIVYFL